MGFSQNEERDGIEELFGDPAKANAALDQRIAAFTIGEVHDYEILARLL